MGFYQDRGKRLFDVLMSVPLLVVVLPLQFLVGLLVWWKLGSPTIFRQERAGLHGNKILISKFRTMSNETDERGNLLPDEDRITPLGAFLRSTSLDELPNLVSVLRGDLSLVGPRPLLTDYLERYSDREGRRHDVRPGITGLAQVRGRNNLSWKQRFELDIWYVENLSLRLDLAILFRTVAMVFSRRGAAPQDSVTMPPFTGQ